jgi:hypothetical protein
VLELPEGHVVARELVAQMPVEVHVGRAQQHAEADRGRPAGTFRRVRHFRACHHRACRPRSD